MKRPSITCLKKKAWKLCSEYVRRSNADQDGMCQCITCNVCKHWKEMQAGHLIGGRGNSILFDERGIYPQCYVCNCMKHGNVIEYVEFLRRKHGKEEADKLVDSLRMLSKQTKTIKWFDYEYIIESYKTRLLDLTN